VLQKLREHKAFAKKLSRALGRGEWSSAKSLEDNKPVYNLDHIIKERWVDAVFSGIANFLTLSLDIPHLSMRFGTLTTPCVWRSCLHPCRRTIEFLRLSSRTAPSSLRNGSSTLCRRKPFGRFSSPSRVYIIRPRLMIRLSHGSCHINSLKLCVFISKSNHSAELETCCVLDPS
jgi:hypothetical protein